MLRKRTLVGGRHGRVLVSVFRGIEEAEVNRQGNWQKLSSHVYRFHPAGRRLAGSLIVFLIYLV